MDEIIKKVLIVTAIMWVIILSLITICLNI